MSQIPRLYSDSVDTFMNKANLDLDFLHQSNSIEYDIDAVVKNMVQKVVAETRNKIGLAE